MEELSQQSLVGRFCKKISKGMSDWSAMLYLTTDLQNLPTSVKVEKGKTSTFVTVTGLNLPELEGCNIRFFGSWGTNKKYGAQFRADSYEIIPPNTEKGLVSFLASGRFPGIGKKTAQAIVAMFGTNTIDIIENTPNKLLAIRGITPQKLGTLVDSYQDVQTYSRLAVFLAPYGLSADLVLKINKKYGKTAIDTIQSNPYILQKVRGIGFKTCDRIARGIGVALDSPQRIEGGVIDRLNFLCELSGNMYVDINTIYYETLKLLNDGINPPPINKTIFEKAFKDMADTQKIIIRKKRDVYLYEYDQAEYNSVQKLLWLQNNSISDKQKDEIKVALDEYLKKCPIKLSEKQKDAVMLSLCNRVSVITGGPGTGKSTIESAIIACYKKVFGSDIELMAPTGKAARRMAEVTGEKASTIHSRLHIFEDMNKISNSIDSGLVIVDEVSMVDGLLLEKLTKAISSRDCHLILIGDVDQLPSVGPGSVLSEIINSKVIPTTRLTEIFRQKEGGVIVENAIKINNGIMDLNYNDDFMLIEANNEVDAKNKILDIYQKEVAERGIDNVALLSPLRKTQSRFTCVSDELNIDLQNAINPSQEDKPFCKMFNREYRVGDRVMQWKNCETSSNGDIGEILSIYNDSDYGVTVKIKWDNGNTINAHKEDLETIDLAYAMSVHKSQGSEYECVIVPMLSCQFSRIHKRNLLYTAVTRAKKKVIIVGDTQAINRTIASNDALIRNSLLSDRLIVNSQTA